MAVLDVYAPVGLTPKLLRICFGELEVQIVELKERMLDRDQWRGMGDWERWVVGGAKSHIGAGVTGSEGNLLYRWVHYTY